MTRCRKETSYKYIIRNSPPYSANKCKSLKKKGNDGFFYKSVPNKRGVYRWIKVKRKIYKSKKKKSLKGLKRYYR